MFMVIIFLFIQMGLRNHPLVLQVVLSLYPLAKAPFSKECSMFPSVWAEQAAILLALEWLCEYRPLQAVIFSDSLSTLLLLKQGVFTASAIILGILLKIRDLALNGTDVMLCWIPSHCDISGNEAADLLAKKKKKTHSRKQSYFYKTK